MSWTLCTRNPPKREKKTPKFIKLSAILGGFYVAKFVTPSEEESDGEDKKQQNREALANDIGFYGNVLKILLETCTEPHVLPVVSI